MKRHIFSMAAAAIVALAFVGCEDLVKDDIDAKYLVARDVNLSAPVCTDITYESVNVSYTVDGDTAGLDPIYFGIVFSTKEDFSERLDFNTLPGEIDTLAVAGATKYYVKSYCVVGNSVKYSEVTQITTPAPPVFEDTYLFGSYLAYDDGNPNPDLMYPMEISWVENTYNRIKITNWWGGGQTITATVDFENKQIIVDFEPAICNYADIDPDAGLGWVYFYGLNENGEPTEDLIIGTYDDKGNISFPGFFIYVDGLGFYAPSCTDMVKAEEEEE